DNPGDYLRSRFSPEHGNKNRHQQAAFLDEVEHQPELHKEIIEWFLSLPLWLDLPGLRVVHACWHQRFMDYLAPLLATGARIPLALMPAATREPDNKTENDNATP